MHNARTSLVLVAALALSACGGGSKLMKADLDLTKQNKAKLAVISLTVSDFGKTLQATSDSNVGELVTKKMNQMLSIAEASFGQSWTVVPAESFVATEGYKKYSIGQLFQGVYGPKIGEAGMLSFSKKRGDLVKTSLEPTVAAKICGELGVDLIVLVYSEWTTQTGGVVPTTKALTKNVVGMYDSRGRMLFQDRKDVLGDKKLGAFGKAVVDEDTLDVWVRAYEKGLGELLAKM